MYKGNRIVKRIGGYIGAVGAGGYAGIYIDAIYDEVEYTSANLITLRTKDDIGYLDGSVNKREIILEKGLIKQKITYDDKSNHAYTDTIFYFYDSQRRLQSTKQGLKHRIVERDYFFDSNGNLQRIVGVEKSRYDDTVLSKTEELFGGYDDKPNPLKGQCLWQDLLYRTLSTNNFTTYSYKTEGASESKSWVLVYGDDGRVDYSN